MNLPLNGHINVKKITFEGEYLLVVKVFDENEFFEYHFINTLRFFSYKEKENLSFNQVEDAEKIKRYEEKYFEGPPQYSFNVYQFSNANKEVCIEILSQSYEVKRIGKK